MYLIVSNWYIEIFYNKENKTLLNTVFNDVTSDQDFESIINYFGLNFNENYSLVEIEVCDVWGFQAPTEFNVKKIIPGKDVKKYQALL